jgi:alpha-tubulin suppressor-like RCC1 family protein
MQVTAGNNQTAVIKTDGSLWAWGTNNIGQVGDNTVINRSSPVQIGALTNWYQVSAGEQLTASVKTDGTSWAWGSNSVGQLGQGNVIYRSSPVQVGALTNWAQISAGSSFVASVKTDGSLWTWGLNGNGQLGQNIAPTVNRSSPVQVGALTNWAQVSAGDRHASSVKTD